MKDNRKCNILHPHSTGFSILNTKVLELLIQKDKTKNDLH